jgi:RecA-superfamily ATPases implicated in signal transduction
MSSGPAGERSRVRDSGEEPPLIDFDPGTNVLVSGPPLIGKYDLMLQTLARGTDRDEASVIVATRDDEEAVIDDYERVASGFDRSRLGIVECISGQRGGATEHEGETLVRRASSPADLTGLGIGASELMSDLHDDGAAGIRLGVDSLSTLLLYTEFDRLARFLHVLSGRVDRAGGIGLFVINPGTIDAAQFDQLKTLFDGLVELRERNERREIRVRGLPGVENGWRPYDAADLG